MDLMLLIIKYFICSCVFLCINKNKNDNITENI